ncbi:hypothetical protein ACT691_00175 [Vibrio metschnikovii]
MFIVIVALVGYIMADLLGMVDTTQRPLRSLIGPYAYPNAIWTSL